MEALAQAPALFLGLIGWVASAKVICDASMRTSWQRGALLAFTWMLWMVPAFDIAVYHGLMPADVAVTYGSVLTVAVVAGIIFSLSAARRRSKQ
jgi:hypothetical protein